MGSAATKGNKCVAAEVHMSVPFDRKAVQERRRREPSTTPDRQQHRAQALSYTKARPCSAIAPATQATERAQASSPGLVAWSAPMLACSCFWHRHLREYHRHQLGGSLTWWCWA